MTMQTALYPDSPTITLYDPLGELLGAGDGYYEYHFDDAVKLAGHACPTVAGAFVMGICALEELYQDETPVRGDIRIEVAGSPSSGSTGPFTQILTLLTGAAAENGFRGLNGRFVRHGLLAFNPDTADGPLTATLHRLSNSTQVTLSYDPSSIPADPEAMKLMKDIMGGNGDKETRQRFATLWRRRVDAILDDRGASTIKVLG